MYHLTEFDEEGFTHYLGLFGTLDSAKEKVAMEEAGWANNPDLDFYWQQQEYNVLARMCEYPDHESYPLFVITPSY